MTQDVIQVLIIEDNPGDAGLIRRMLQAEAGPSIALRHVTTFTSGMELLRSGAVDVMLLDLALTETAGLETIAQALSISPDIPIIVLTGTDATQIILECIKAGAKDYFVKSRIDPRRLVRVIRDYTQKSE